MRIRRAAAEIEPVSAMASSRSALPGPIAIPEPAKTRIRIGGRLDRERGFVMSHDGRHPWRALRANDVALRHEFRILEYLHQQRAGDEPADMRPHRDARGLA